MNNDRIVLQNWLRGGATLGEVLGAARYGNVGNARFSHAAVRRFVFLWTWSAQRFGSEIGGPAHDRTYAWGGREVLSRRIARINRIIDALKD